MKQKKFCPDVASEDMFFILVLEEFKSKRKLAGKDALKILESSGAKEYIYNCYGALHTESIENTLLDLEEMFKI